MPYNFARKVQAQQSHRHYRHISSRYIHTFDSQQSDQNSLIQNVYFSLRQLDYSDFKPEI